MTHLIHQRCFNHAAREAAARCPDCGHCYCRECIAEHDGRVICAACLRRIARPPLTSRRAFAGLLRLAQFFAGLFLLWLFFHFVGRMLLSIPSSFHEGTVWRGKWLEPQ